MWPPFFDLSNMCPYPIYVHKHGIDVPCGKCGYCLRRSINDWVLRCKYEHQRSYESYFLTLTFSEVPDGLLVDSKSFRRPLQLFFKRCRKYGLSFRYFAIGDYGDTYGRPHYHVLFYSDVPVDTDLVHSLWSSKKYQENGFVKVDRYSVHRCRYVVEYALLGRLDHHVDSGRPKPFTVMSKRPAIGSSFLTKERVRYHRYVDGMLSDEGFKYALPRYYRKKIFNFNSKTGLGFRYQGFEDIVEKTKTQVKALSKFHPDPESYLVQRRMRSADQYLFKLRERKKQKNKLYVG